MAKIGLYLCECGPNIADAVDLDRIKSEIEQDGKVVGVERHKLLCSEDGKKFLAESIKEKGFDRVVIAACSPKQHEATFMDVMRDAGLNPYMFQLVNIREQCAWMTSDKELATRKALRFIRAAISRVKYHKALERKEIECNADVIVIGGGIAGMEAALRAAQKERRVYIIEQAELGGRLKHHRLLFPTMESAEDFLKAKIDAVRGNDQIEVLENSEIRDVLGFFGNFVATIETEEKEKVTLNAGSVLLATGAVPFDPEGLSNFGYGKYDDVYTASEFERASADEIVTKSGQHPHTVAVIHCVGRKKLGYCSKLCCVNSMKIARHIKEQLNDTRVIQLYKNLCLPGKEYDRFYEETAEKGIEFIRFKEIEVTDEAKQLSVKYKMEDDTEKSLPVDMVILSTGLAPNSATQRFAEMFNIPADGYGFFKEEHVKLDPVSTITEGVFIAGCAQGPGDIRDSMAQAGAAAGRILSSLTPGGRIKLEPETSEVSESLCVGCGACVNVCAYGAVTIDELQHISVVNEVLCRGCGNCAAACPSGAARHRHFTTTQITHEMGEILR